MTSWALHDARSISWEILVLHVRYLLISVERFTLHDVWVRADISAWHWIVLEAILYI